jgi:hypothetical protein
MSLLGKRVVLMDDLSWEDGEGTVEFRLTYAGLLLASNSRRDTQSARKTHKHEIRRIFHKQLKRLWEITPFLKSGKRSGSGALLFGGNSNRPDYTVDTLQQKHAHYGWNFVPLVTHDLNLSCWLDILFLRRQPPGELFKHGDIDNRLKALFDCLQIPDANQEYHNRTPEDDEMISKISVETDILLEEVKDKSDEHDARLVITARLKPYEMTLDNMQFG